MVCFHNIFVVALSAGLTYGIDNRDNWTSIADVDIYKDLDECSRLCVLTVNDKVYDVRQQRTCVSWGCNCSDSDKAGPNYQNAKSNVTECAKTSCDNEEALVIQAEKTFDQLCLISSLNENQEPVQNGTYPIIGGPKYSNLGPCEKFLLNGCVDADGNKEEDCHPDIYADGWETYRGIAHSRQCPDYECMCRGASNFTASFDELLDAGLRYCGLRPSVKENPNQEADDLKIVFAEDCTRAKYPHDNFTWTYSGEKPGSDKEDEMSASDWVQLVLTPLATLLSLVATVITARMWFLMEKSKTPPNSPPSTP